MSVNTGSQRLFERIVIELRAILSFPKQCARKQCMEVVSVEFKLSKLTRMLASSASHLLAMIKSRSKRRPSVDPASKLYAGKHKSVGKSTTGQCRERAALPHSAQCQLRSQQRIRVNSRGFQCSLRFQVKAHSRVQASVPNIPAP